MNSVLLVLGAFVLYLVAYHTYGKYLAKKIFELREDAVTPAHELRDGVDYEPTKKAVIFGHHFASIAGLGPIVGPAIAIIWGWLPAVLWVVFGSILMGGIHDFGSLVASLRNKGRSIGELTAELVNPRTRTLFFLIIFFELWIVIAIFAMIMGILFNMYPQSVFPVWMTLPIAIGVGLLVRHKGANITLFSIIAIGLILVTIVIGAYFPLQLRGLFGLSSIETWLIILLIYSFFASILPVWLLLQPRDYVNAYQLLIVMALLVLGTLVAHPKIVAPAVNHNPVGAPSIWPFLFVIIACGAISGFHSLVSSGTTAKQINKEPDALFVGYGSMLTESALSILVIVAVSAGIGMRYITRDGSVLTGFAAWNTHYSSWIAAQGLGSKLTAFITGSANLITSLGIPQTIATTVMGVFIVSFAGTTLDTATRIQRYVIGEFFTDLGLPALANRYIATFIAVASAGLLAFAQKGGKGALVLWPLFGTVNQLLAGLALLIVTVYLAKMRKPIIYTLLPMVFMVFMTGWAMVKNIIDFAHQHNTLLFVVGIAVFLLELWMIVEAALAVRKYLRRN
ncbi:carbon starvation protein A [bacterium]|nr:carbon starvation protein A [bacterium]